MTLSVKDIAKNSATQEVKLNVKEELPKEITISLTPSTTGETQGPVTVTVATDSEKQLVALKWLKGEKVAADFVEGGIDIDLTAKSFDVQKMVRILFLLKIALV